MSNTLFGPVAAPTVLLNCLNGVLAVGSSSVFHCVIPSQCFCDSVTTVCA